jgi:hypothetical protein
VPQLLIVAILVRATSSREGNEEVLERLNLGDERIGLWHVGVDDDHLERDWVVRRERAAGYPHDYRHSHATVACLIRYWLSCTDFSIR